MGPSKLRLLLLFSVCSSLGQFNEVRFGDVVVKMEDVVSEAATHIELLFEKRCDLNVMQKCAFGSYDHCVSKLSTYTCHGGKNLHVPVCGDNTTCSSRFDFNRTTVRIPQAYSTGVDSNPEDPQVIEAICATQDLDEWFPMIWARDASFWMALGEAPRAAYFAHLTGAFRIFPARPSEMCGAYDPSERPWYIAASSGPKNVVLILDFSGSMIGLPIEQTKLAAVRIIETLTSRDTVAIIVFHTTARLIDDAFPFLVQATAENKATLVDLVRQQGLGNQTNFLDAFQCAFDMLEALVSLEKQACANSRSNTAILFLADGMMNVPSTNTEPVVQLVSERIANLTDRLNIVLFTYSISGAEDVDSFPSHLACSVEQGIWTKITSDSDIVESLSSYYKIFAHGLERADFTAWIEPFKAATGDVYSVAVSNRLRSYRRSTNIFGSCCDGLWIGCSGHSVGRNLARHSTSSGRDHSTPCTSFHNNMSCFGTE